MSFLCFNLMKFTLNQFHIQLMRHVSNLPVLYAQICPQQPTIPRHRSQNSPIQQIYENQIEDELSQATRVITHKKYVKQFQPKIIKSRRMPFHHSFELMERNREIKSMKSRIENVKSMNQRKKDKNDPIVYPPYFVRGIGENEDVRIDGYMKKVLNSTSWKQKQKQLNKIYNQQQPTIQQSRTNRQIKKYKYNLSPKQEQKQRTQIQRDQNPQHQSQMPSPVFYRKQPVILRPVQSTPTYNRKKTIQNLPANDIRSVLDYVYHNLLYKDKDLQALKSRMIHAYGKEQVQNTWKLSMRLLERDI